MSVGGRLRRRFLEEDESVELFFLRESSLGGGRFGTTGRGTTVLAQAGVSGSIQPALVGAGAVVRRRAVVVRRKSEDREDIIFDIMGGGLDIMGC